MNLFPTVDNCNFGPGLNFNNLLQADSQGRAMTQKFIQYSTEYVYQNSMGQQGERSEEKTTRVWKYV